MIKQEKADKMGKKLVPWWDKELQHLKFCSILSFVETMHYACIESLDITDICVHI